MRELPVELDEGATVADLRAVLAGKLEGVGELGDRLAVSVNLEVANQTQVAPLDEAEVVRRVAGDDTGGVVSFVGTVRDQSRGHSIKYLEYEAYPEMAEREMQKICDEAAQRWPGTRVAIAHRIGHLDIGDAAVVVVAAAPHRGEAFDACRFAIDTLKLTVPIWKKEMATDGEYWVDDHA